MEQLTIRLSESLRNTRIVLSSTASAAELLDYKKVFLTSYAPHCASVLSDRHPALSEQIASVPAAPIGILYLAVPRKDVMHPLDGFGFLVPPIFRCTLRGVVFSSSVFPERAPKGFHLLTCYLGTDPRITGVQDRVLWELDQLIGLSAAPVVLDTVYHPRALPSYHIGHHRRQEEVEKFHQEQERIRIVASWYKGLSVAQRVGEALAVIP